MGRVAWLLLLSLCLCCCLSTARASSSSLVLDAEVDMEADSEALQLQWVEKPGKASGGATKTGASAADTTKKGASSSARGGRAPAASRLTSSVHKSKYARFVAKHPKRAKKHPKGFETFVKNREKIVALNDKYASKATATPFKSSGPFADLSPSEFKKKFLNVKSHRGRGKGKPVKSGKGSRTKASGSTDSKKKSVSIPRAEKGTSKKRKGSRAMLEIMTKGDGHRVGGAGSGVKKSGKTGGDSGGSVDKSGKTGGDGGSSVDKSGKTGGGGNAVGWSGSNSNPTTNSQVNGWNGLDFLKSTLATAYSGQVASLNAAPAVITIQDVVKSLNSAGVTTAQFNAALSILAVPRKYYGDFPIFQQDECGSCWAQVASNAVYANTKPIRPSIQQLLDCVKTTETDGCNGGTPMDAIDFMAKTPLADIEQYPTLGGTQVGQCKQFPARSFSQPKLSVSGWSMAIPACTQENCAGQQKYELDILNQTRQLTLGTRPIMYVDASKWQHYSGGIFPITECSSTLSAGNHVVELAGAGYDQASQMPYWLIRNSWGTDWGEQGLIKVPFGVNACGLFNFVIVVNP